MNFDHLFSNIGGKLKKLAGIITVVGIVLGVSILVISFSNSISRFGNFGLFIGGILGGSAIALIFWISSLSIYAFGELVEKTTQIEINTRKNDSEE